MADIVDDAAARTDLFLKLAQEEHKRRQSKYYFTGLCWNCSEPLEEGAFCPEGGFCQEDYEKRERMR